MAEDWAARPRMTSSQIADIRAVFEERTRDVETEVALNIIAELERERTARDHLRNRVHELLRRLPVDLPAEAANMRLIVSALVSETTERLEREGLGGS